MFFLIFLFCGISLSFAEELEGIFRPNNAPSKVILPGEIFDGVIQLWPYAEKDSKMFFKLADSSFLDFFYIASVDEIKVSENNADVLEIEVTAILKKNFTVSQFYIWSFENKNIPIKIKDLIIGKTEEEAPADYLILNQKEKAKYKTTYIISLAFLFLLIVVISLKISKKIKLREARRIKIGQKRDILKIIKLLKKTTTRREFESLYKERAELLKYLFDNNYLSELFAKIELIHYKKEWIKAEYDELYDLKNKIRTKLKESYGI